MGPGTVTIGAATLIDPAPTIRMALVGVLIALVPLALTWWRRRRLEAREGAHENASWLRALTLTTLILTFDLVLFGSFTRLTDSGLGCPDWPGCYGHASPLGAKASIDAAAAVQPDGPVTHAKAWIEMIHRYFAMTVGVLIVVMTIEAWRVHMRSPIGASPWWPTATLAWVIAQGAFGALTVTMRLYPAIVTLHLLLGLGLLAMLAMQAERARGATMAVSTRTRRMAWVFVLLLVAQVALGGWVSTNYAVLACRDFPMCQGQWWPPMDFGEGFTLARELGRSGSSSSYLPFAALTAIHVAHRVGAAVLLLAIVALSWMLRREASPAAHRFAGWFAALGAWQLASGLSNVVLGWPIVAALAHVGGAAGLTVVAAALLVRVRDARAPARVTGVLSRRSLAS